jgi:hypothetical protein
LYELQAQEQRPAARLLQTERIGLTAVAVIELNPVRYAPDGRLEFAETTELGVTLEQEVTPRDGRDSGDHDLASSRLSLSQAKRFTGLARAAVVNPDEVEPVAEGRIDRLLPYEYLVITSATAGSSDGDDAEPDETFAQVFQDLVNWKWSRGVAGRVVTVEEIEGGRFGEFSSRSRDRPETIRRFLQWAVPVWGVSWVLLGGSDELIPARRVAGSSHAEIWLSSKADPEANCSYWTGTFLMMRVEPEKWPYWQSWYDGAELVRLDNGLKIPFDEDGSSGIPTLLDPWHPGRRLGWYFTADRSGLTRSAKPSGYVRVNGPASDIRADHHFVYGANLLPTDLYYASLFGPLYGSPRRHDWDWLDNGLYGQFSRGDAPERRSPTGSRSSPIAAAAIPPPMRARTSWARSQSTPPTARSLTSAIRVSAGSLARRIGSPRPSLRHRRRRATSGC